MATILDQTRFDAFGEKLTSVLNHAGIALMISIGHRTKLFDVMANLGPSTSDEIATASGLSERYVREWLGAMSTGGVIEHQSSNNTYQLPAEHAGWLTRRASPNNFAAAMQWAAVLGQVEDEIVDAFSHGNGVPYSSYKRFHIVMAEESAQSVVAVLFTHLLPLVPGLIEKLETGIEVLDVGCGSGRAINEMAAHFPKSRFHGYDASPEGIAVAQRESTERRLTNVTFEVKDVAHLKDDKSFDLITAFDAIHDQADPAGVLSSIAKALKPDGVFLMQDISGSGHVHGDMKHPFGPFLYTISCMHCMSVSLASGGPGLGAMWGREKALAMLSDAGFKSVAVNELPHDPMNFYYVARLR
jgi:2-polyprenyl-3-methyl-5-hydroxy-6-metoxy-1,4-benzoquinol methylase